MAVPEVTTSGRPEPASAAPSVSTARRSAVAVFRIAFDRWVREDGDPDLRALVHATLDELQALATPLRPGAR
jgi:hypothetical protein